MKHKTIIYAFTGVALVMLLVWYFAYRPVFSEEFSIENVDWGGFGDFFWGLGTMLLTALNVYVVYMINKAIESSGRAKDRYEIQKAIFAEYKSLRDKTLYRKSANHFQVNVNHIAQLESFIRELRCYENIFPFLKEDRKRESLNILQERLRLYQDKDSLDEWKKTHDPKEWDSFLCSMYSHSEWILEYMTKDWCDTVINSLKPTI